MGRYFKEQESSYDRMNKRIQYKKNLQSLGDPTQRETRQQATHASILNVLSKDIDTSYDNENLQKLYKRFSDYYNRNVDNFDESTHEIFQFVKDDFTEMYERNTSFKIDTSKLEAQRDEVMQLVENYDNAFRKTEFTSEDLGGGNGFGPPVRLDTDSEEEWKNKESNYFTILTP